MEIHMCLSQVENIFIIWGLRDGVFAARYLMLSIGVALCMYALPSMFSRMNLSTYCSETRTVSVGVVF